MAVPLLQTMSTKTMCCKYSLLYICGNIVHTYFVYRAIIKSAAFYAADQENERAC